MASYTKTVQMFKRHFETTISMTGRNVAQTERGSVTRRRIAPLRTLFRLSLKRHNSFCPLVLQIKHPGIIHFPKPPAGLSDQAAATRSRTNGTRVGDPQQIVPLGTPLKTARKKSQLVYYLHVTHEPGRDGG